MMWCSKSGKAGFSLTEVLVVLAILSLTITVFATARPGPSPAMQQEARVSELIAAAAHTHAEAIRKGTAQFLDLTGPLCPDNPTSLTFFANGTATEARICLTGETQNAWLQLDPFTGQLMRADAP